MLQHDLRTQETGRAYPAEPLLWAWCICGTWKGTFGQGGVRGPLEDFWGHLETVNDLRAHSALATLEALEEGEEKAPFLPQVGLSIASKQTLL